MLQSIPTAGRLTRYGVSWAALGVLAMTLSACQESVAPSGSGMRGPSSASSRDAQSASSRIPDEYIVVFKDDVGDVGGRANALVNAHGGSLHFTYSSALKGFSAHMSAQAAEAILNDPNVAYVEQDQTTAAAGIGGSGVETPAVGGLDRIDQRSWVLDNSYSWSNDGAGVTVYILDTGIRISHQDFGGRAVYGPDLVSSTSSNDCNGHGTHVAGTVGGAVYGVAKGVSLVAVRVLDCSGKGTASTVIAGLNWVISNHVPLSIANLSLSSAFSSSVNQAVANTIAAGVTVVTAAGDLGAPPDACQYSPASANGAITVGASRSTASGDEMAGFSNYGSCVSIFAPGQSVVSDWYTGDNILWMLDGTSMAAAHTSGAAAIYLATNTSASPSAIKNALISNATTGTLTNLPSGSANRLLYTGDGSALPPPPPPPANAAPVANFNATCNKANCSFNASASSDDVGIVGYAWNFGDGGSLSGTSAQAAHTYTTKGTYSRTVTLTVTDAGGLTGSTSKTLTIKNSGK